MSRRGLALFLAMGVIWGIPYLLIKVAVGSLTPATLVFLRTAIGAFIIAPLAVRTGRWRELVPHWKALAAYTAAEIAVPWWLLSDAETRLSSSLSGLLIASMPIVMAVLAALSRLEAFTLRRGAGLILGLGGVTVLLAPGLSAGNLGPILEVGIVVLGYAIGPLIISQKLASLRGMDVVAVTLLASALAYLPAAIIQAPAHWPGWEVAGAVLILGVVCTGVGFLCFFALITEVGPTRASLFIYLNPAVAVVLGVALLHEPFSLLTLAGFVLILGGSVLASRRQPARPGDPADSAA
ncbi:MAG: DMT family transporter [Clostridia bacterium]